ncbi:hypothetical protein SAMN05877753_105381 [Bacillus oleivorans]|uniref:Uncharacterized protein n=1 Tax=Bacillus oleivorans TaxID=1448271 RepID=A0A285CWK2_9BACI|nr:hypothetical protein [Bacillus oleivorans]SNX71795.1 hypothetical protein SAMN05877753_105381 [Bacillus oleivorans]
MKKEKLLHFETKVRDSHDILAMSPKDFNHISIKTDVMELISTVKEQQKEIAEDEKAIEWRDEQLQQANEKIKQYEEHLRFISGEGTTVFAETFEEARESARAALEGEPNE